MLEVKSNQSAALAVDLGGTQIRVAIVSHQGEILAKETSPTMAAEGPEPVIDRIQATIEAALETEIGKSSPPANICIAAAGAIDVDKGIITLSPNLPGWHDIPLRDMVKERCGLETYLINDANAAALGEHRFGAGKGVSDMLFLTVSTGIGGGIIIGGELYSGASGGAGEMGHMTIDTDGPVCTCGNNGCLEQLASGTAMAREAKQRLNNGKQSKLLEMVDGKIDEVTAAQISVAAQAGDSLAQEVVSRAAMYLGIGLASLVNIFNPEMIVIGGSVSKMGSMLFDPAIAVVQDRAFPLLARAVSIVRAQNIDDAGLLGAAVFAFQQGLSQEETR